jgi:hypothetical protein
MPIDPFIAWRSRGIKGATTPANSAGRWRVIQGGVQFTQWRPLPSTPPSLHPPRIVQTGVQVIPWRSRLAAGVDPSTSGGFASSFRADGSGTARWTGSGPAENSFSCAGSGTAEFSAGAKEGRFQCDGSGTASFTSAVTPQLGHFQCDGSGTVTWVGQLSAVRIACVVGDGSGFGAPDSTLPKNVSHAY